MMRAMSTPIAEVACPSRKIEIEASPAAEA